MQRVALLADLAIPGTRSAQIDGVDIILVRDAFGVYAYRNQCPHLGVGLEWRPHEFLDESQQHLICSTHGALFQLQDGHCVFGPCAGESLQALEVDVQGNAVYVALPER